MARSIIFQLCPFSSLLGIILSGVYHFIFRKVQMSDGGGSRFVYVIGLHADQFRNKVYSYGAKLFFTRHKPDSSLLFPTLAFFSQV